MLLIDIDKSKEDQARRAGKPHIVAVCYSGDHLEADFMAMSTAED